MFRWIKNLFGHRSWPKGRLVPAAVGTQAEKLAAQGNLRGAVAVYEKFLSNYPDSAHALNNAAGFLLELGDGRKAKEFLEKALKIDPDYDAALCNLAEAKLMLKDLLGARDTFERALRTHPRSVSARMGLGRMFLELKNGKMACQHLAEAVSLQPRNPVAWHNLGAARMMVGDLDGAEEAFKKVLAIDPRSESGRQGLMRVQSMRQMAAIARHSGATVRTRDGTIISGANRTVVCHACSRRYTEHGQVRLGERSLGGALCRICGKFYCEPCVARVVHSPTALMQCACGKARAMIGENGYVKLEGFEELVVFPAT